MKEERPSMLEAFEMLGRLPLPDGKSRCVVCGCVADVEELRLAGSPAVGHAAGCRLAAVQGAAQPQDDGRPTRPPGSAHQP